MRKFLTIIGFGIAVAASFTLMQMENAQKISTTPWGFDGIHVQRISRDVRAINDKCKLDRLQGRLKNKEAAAVCSNPSIREAFVKEGYPFKDKLDAFIARRLEIHKMGDEGKLSDEDMQKEQDKALGELLNEAVIADLKK